MNSAVYLIVSLAVIAATVAACRWAGMNRRKTANHIIALPGVLLLFGFVVWLGVATPFAILGAIVESTSAAESLDRAFAPLTLALAGVVGLVLATMYFRNEKDYLASRRLAWDARRSRARRRAAGVASLAPVIEMPSDTGEGTVYVLPKAVTASAIGASMPEPGFSFATLAPSPSRRKKERSPLEKSDRWSLLEDDR